MRRWRRQWLHLHNHKCMHACVGMWRAAYVHACMQVVNADEAEWAGLLRRMASTGSSGVNEAAFMEALQRRMETVVLGLTSGSYAQRVQVGMSSCAVHVGASSCGLIELTPTETPPACSHACCGGGCGLKEVGPLT